MLNYLYQFILNQAYNIAEAAKVTFGNDTTWGGGFSSIWDGVVKISNNVLEPIAVLVVVVIFLLSLVEKVSTEQFTLESVLKDVIKLCMGLYLVTNAVEIVVGTIELGNALINEVTAADFLARPQLSAYKDEILTGSQLKEFGNFVATVLLGVFFLIFMLIEMFIILIMKCVCTIRTLEIAIRTSMAPIALADTFAGNLLNSHAINFIRSFAALCLQGVFITIISYVLPMFWGGLFVNCTSMWDVLGGLLSMFVISISCLLLMFKSGSIAKEMLGAR